MRIEERLERKDNEDIIILGELLKSEGVQLVRLMVKNLINLELSHSRADGASSDKKIGRLEGYQTVLDDIAGFIQGADELNIPVNPESEESYNAEEQITQVGRGGEI